MMTLWLFYFIFRYPPENLSVMLECVGNVHHIYQLLECLAAVDFAIILVASRLSLVMIPRRQSLWASVWCGTIPLSVMGGCCWNIFEGLVWYVKISWEGFHDDVYVPLMCCEYKDILLLTRVQPIQRAAESCDSALAGSKDALYIQLSALELSVNTKMFEPCPSYRIVM